MNLKIILPEKKIEDTVLIGKTGFLRIKSSFAKKYNLSKSEKWVVGVDSEEAGLKKNIYLFRSGINNNHLGKKMLEINNSYSFDMNLLIQQLKIKAPVTCKMQPFEQDEYSGFQIQLTR